jgi:hypothetical protein
MSKTTENIVTWVDRGENWNKRDSYNANREVECDKCGSTVPNKQHLAPKHCKKYDRVFFMCEECIVEEEMEGVE